MNAPEPTITPLDTTDLYDLSDSACLRAIQVRVEKACEDLLTTPTDADELFEIVRGADPDFPNVPHKLWTLYQESDITHAYLACLIEDRGPRHGH